jgi:hypothetical protein
MAALILAPTWAHADCLTLKEARDHWPDERLVWRTENHCWMPKRLSGNPHWRTPKLEPGPKVIPAGQIETKATPEERQEPTILYPLVVYNQANILEEQPLVMRQPWLSPEFMHEWPILIDIDRPFRAWDKRIGQ